MLSLLALMTPMSIREELQAELPSLYRPQVRFKAFYGLDSDMGMQFNFDYSYTFAGESFADELFGYMNSIAVPDKPLTDCSRGIQSQHEPRIRHYR